MTIRPTEETFRTFYIIFEYFEQCFFFFRFPIGNSNILHNLQFIRITMGDRFAYRFLCTGTDSNAAIILLLLLFKIEF